MANFGDLSPDNTIVGGTDSTTIGNVDDALKVTGTLYADSVQHVEMLSILRDIIRELKIMNLHLESITEEGISRRDVK